MKRDAFTLPPTVAVLFARADSTYKTLPGTDVWDIERNARLWPGCAPADTPPIPLRLGEATHVVQSRKRTDHRPHITKAEREDTPPELARWLCELARRSAISRPPQWRGPLPEHLEASCSRIHSSNASRIAVR